VGHVFRLLEAADPTWLVLENVPFMLQLDHGRAMRHLPPNAYFGLSVTLSGTTALVGALRGAGDDGAVYEFLQSVPSWSQEAELTAASGAVHDEFGYSVAISGSTGVVGAVGTNSSAGAAYIWVLP
jgi:hypothetical protein